jgi:hypothetical protein
LALRVKDRAAEDGKQRRGRSDGEGPEMSYGGTWEITPGE